MMDYIYIHDDFSNIRGNMIMTKSFGVHSRGTAIQILMLGLLLAGSANAATIDVCLSGCAYSSIQSAINASNTGDTILVQSGTYSENVNVTKKLTLRGIGNPVVNTDGGGSGITLSANGITLEGFTVTESGGITISASNNNTLIGNKVYNNSGGIFLDQSSSNMLSGNNVSYNYATGIELSSYSDNNTLIGNIVSSTIPVYWSSGHGIILAGSNNNLTGNNVSNNIYGIFLPSSGKNILKNNIMNENRYNFGLLDDTDSVFNNQIDTTNLVDGKFVYFLKGAKDTVYDSYTNAGTFYCINCVNITVKNLDLKNNKFGIFFWNTTKSRVQNVNASNNWHGISLFFSHKNTLIGSNVSFNCEGHAYGQDYGIFLFSSGNNTLSGNNVLNNCYGIRLDSSSDNNTLNNNNASSNNAMWNAAGISVEYSNNNTLSGNNASDNDHGVRLYYSNINTIKDNNISYNGLDGVNLDGNNNTLTGNVISDNGLYYGSPGISISASNNNSIYNNIFNNINNIKFYDSNTNIWNITRQSGTNIIGGPYQGGNFWGNPNGTGFSQTCPDMNSDGICDDPLVLETNNTDYLPLSWLPSIYFTYPTPADGANLTQNYAYINTTVSGSTAFIDWNSSLAGWWRFNNESGENASFFRDWSSHGNNAACSRSNCPVAASGKFGNSLNFDGINDYIDAGNGESLDITGAITIETWVNPAISQEKCWDGSSGNYGVMSKVSDPLNSVNWSWQLRFGAPGGGCYLGFNFNGNPEGSRWVSVKQNLTAGQWYHIAGTFNGTDINSYLNGNLMETDKISAIKGYRNKLIFGNDGWNNSFRGKIDEIRIHKRALSPEEIKASCNAGMYGLYRNFTYLAIGTHNYQAYTQNLQGNLNQTENRTLNRVTQLTGTISGSVRTI